MKLDEKGRCCGRKPIHYRNPMYSSQRIHPRPSKHCDLCDRAYDPKTGLQIENWAWQLDVMGVFRDIWGRQ